MQVVDIIVLLFNLPLAVALKHRVYLGIDVYVVIVEDLK